METTSIRPNRTEPDPRRRTPNDPAPQSESDALASVEAGEPVALPTPRGVVRGLVATFARPRPLAREAARLGRDSVRILRGTDEIAPSPKDKRFADPAWSQHPGYRRLGQSYVAWSDAL